MTPQQAGVSALLKLWLDCFDDGELVANEARKESWYETSLVQPTRAALATAPPEQAARPTVSGASPVCLDCNKAGLRNCSHFDNCDGVWVYKPNPPQAASAGALSAEQVREALNSADSQEWETPEEWAQHVADRLNAALAAHDQKVGDQLAAWMIVNNFATGHGDTVEDLLKELKWQIEELRARPAPAASKPEAGKGEK